MVAAEEDLVAGDGWVSDDSSFYGIPEASRA